MRGQRARAATASAGVWERVWGVWNPVEPAPDPPGHERGDALLRVITDASSDFVVSSSSVSLPIRAPLLCDGVTTLINHISITAMFTLMKVGAMERAATPSQKWCTYWERDCHYVTQEPRRKIRLYRTYTRSRQPLCSTVSAHSDRLDTRTQSKH